MPAKLSYYQHLRNIVRRTGDPDQNGCRRWLGSLTNNGYGVLSTRSLPERLAHRLVWHIRRGPIPGDKNLDHLCRNRWCVEVTHMEQVTFKENVLRGIGPTAINARKTHCKHGHEFTPENTMPAGGSSGGRKCRACHNKLHRDKYRKRNQI